MNSCHPGQVESGLLRGLTAEEEGWNGRVVRLVTGRINQSPEVGVLTQLFLATAPEVEREGVRGRYFVNVARESEEMLNPLVREEGLQEGLWRFSEELVNELGEKGI